MELNVQRALRNGEAFEALCGRLALKSYDHPTLPLVGLKYSQIDSPRFDPIVKECRGIILERDSWDVVAKPFTRFFNYNECVEDTSKFRAIGATMTDKEDGSLILLYHYNDEWHINTSGSFGYGEVIPGGPTWRELFWKTAPFTTNELEGYEGTTFLFELCAHENKVVRRYATPTVYLIGAMAKSYAAPTKWLDMYEYWLDEVAETVLHCKRPRQAYVQSLASIVEAEEYIKGRTEVYPDFEGVVLRDMNNIRIKVKSAEYLTLAHMKDNGNLFREKNLVPWALREDPTELLPHFPECESKLRSVSYDVHKAWGEVQAAYHAFRGIEVQKDFALAIKDKTRFTGILFNARKRAGKNLGSLEEIRVDFEREPERLTKVIYGD
jgi:hypothetical protein